MNNKRVAILAIGLVLVLAGGTVFAQMRGTLRPPEVEDGRGKMPDRASSCEFEYDRRAYGSVDEAGGEWNSLLKVSEIPPDVVEQMSTDCLLKNVMAYPQWGFVGTRNTPQQGFELIRGQFMALDALLKRPDGPAVILKYYQEIDLGRIGEQFEDNPLDAFAHSLPHQLEHLEYMLGQPEITSSLSKENKQVLLKELLQKAEFKTQHVGVFTSMDFETISIVAARVMLSIPEVKFQGLMERNEQLRQFVETAQQPPPNVLKTILEAAEKAVRGEPVSQAEAKLALDIAALPEHRAPAAFQFSAPSQLALYFPACDTNTSRQVNIYTPRGTKFPACQVFSEISDSLKVQNDAWVKRFYPQATLLRGSTRRYNCHSFAWHSQYVYSDIWMNNPGDDVYWLDGSYVNKVFQNSAIPDFAVSYRSDDHSARTVSKTDKNNLISKWGQLGLVKHGKSYCPYNSSNLVYYDQERR